MKFRKQPLNSSHACIEQNKYKRFIEIGSPFSLFEKRTKTRSPASLLKITKATADFTQQLKP